MAAAGEGGKNVTDSNSTSTDTAAAAAAAQAPVVPKPMGKEEGGSEGGREGVRKGGKEGGRAGGERQLGDWKGALILLFLPSSPPPFLPPFLLLPSAPQDPDGDHAL